MDKVRYGRVANTCHMCASRDLHLVLDLGQQPHADRFPTKEQLKGPEIFFPLRLVTCKACGLLQIDYFVNPSILYQDEYLYQSSITSTGRTHYAAMARELCGRFAAPQGSFVVDVGSNVGVLLQGFKDLGMRVLGVDPAPEIARVANHNGIETINDFFTSDLAVQIRKRHGAANLITGTNVFAHLHELDDAVVGMKQLLGERGAIIIEAPHALPLIERVEYDTIYHQHVAYLSVRPMKQYLARMGLELFDVERIAIHGGSLRYFVGHPGEHPVSPLVQSFIDEEERAGLYDEARLHEFAAHVHAQRLALLHLLTQLKWEGKRVVAVSAPAKGNTMLNFCHLGTHVIEYATERNPLKVGRYTPGTMIPIYNDEYLLEAPPDYALILAWNFADEIMARMLDFKNHGGKFIIPIPKPVVL